MNDRKSSMVDSARRLAELRQGKPEPCGAAGPADGEDGIEFEQEGPYQAFSFISADRQQKQMVEFRFLTGNAKALAYSYMVSAAFDPSEGIKLDFSGYAVAITGRHLRPLYNGLVAQRTAVVREMDPLQAEANLGDKATVVTGIKIKLME
jgi:hypothetical protein